MTALKEPEAETIDEFFRGRVRLIQSRRGYRFAVDAPLLADFIDTRPEDEVLELGTGNGAVAVLLSVKPFRHLTAVEIQPALADLARRNVALNGLGDRVEIVEADLRAWRPGRRFDVVFSNPPYIKKRTGVPSPSPEKAVAKHELCGDIFDVLRAAAALLKPDGRACFVYPAGREKDLRAAIASAGMGLQILRRVLARPGEAPVLILAEAGFGADFGVKAGTPERVPPPLVLRDERGRDSTEARAIYEGRGADVG